ncbi:MAG: hypothetical protein WKF84_24665 [Pyrinomonadaceae bacterium]
MATELKRESGDILGYVENLLGSSDARNLLGAYLAHDSERESLSSGSRFC